MVAAAQNNSFEKPPCPVCDSLNAEQQELLRGLEDSYWDERKWFWANMVVIAVFFCVVAVRAGLGISSWSSYLWLAGCYLAASWGTWRGRALVHETRARLYRQNQDLHRRMFEHEMGGYQMQHME